MVHILTVLDFESIFLLAAVRLVFEVFVFARASTLFTPFLNNHNINKTQNRRWTGMIVSTRSLRTIHSDDSLSLFFALLTRNALHPCFEFFWCISCSIVENEHQAGIAQTCRFWHFDHCNGNRIFFQNSSVTVLLFGSVNIKSAVLFYFYGFYAFVIGLFKLFRSINTVGFFLIYFVRFIIALYCSILFLKFVFVRIIGLFTFGAAVISSCLDWHCFDWVLASAIYCKLLCTS